MTYKTELPELGGAFDEPVPDPEPLTPEARYEQASAEYNADTSPSVFIAALRDMIESDRAEIGRLTETVNRQDGTISDLRESLS
jgi:hypothetical protein